MLAKLSHKITLRFAKSVLLLAFVAGGEFSFAKNSCALVYEGIIPDQGKVVQALVQQKERPEPQEIREQDPESLWRYLEPRIDAPERDPRFFKVLEAATMDLLKNYDGRDVFFVARDGEWFYDAMMSVLRGHPKTEKLVERFHLLNLSRPVANSSDGKTLIKYLIANGLDPARVMTGEKRVLLIDTGERGSIFINTLQKIVQTYKFDQTHWKAQITNLLNGFEVQLLHSNMKENKKTVVASIAKMKEFDTYDVAEAIDNLGFGEILKERRKEIGIPVQHDPLHDWIVDTFERRKHWTGRAQSISTKGTVTAFENVDQNREIALYSQAQILAHFSQKSLLAQYAQVLKNAIGVCGKGCAVPAVSTVVEASNSSAGKKTQGKAKTQQKPKLQAKAGQSFETGDIVQTKSGEEYEVLKFIDEGRRGRVYQVKSSSTGKLYALKIAIDKDADTLKSFAEEAEKMKGYGVAGVSHAKAVELGSDFMVKEFIQGVRAKEWLDGWVQDGMPKGTAQLKDLAKQLKLAADRGVYIGDLNPKNLIWNGKKWIIVDSGSWRNDLSQAEILERFEEKVIGRWTKNHSSTVERALKKELRLMAEE